MFVFLWEFILIVELFKTQQSDKQYLQSCFIKWENKRIHKMIVIKKKNMNMKNY